MKKILGNIFGVMGILVLSSFMLQAEDLRKINDLKGYWKFSIGDDMDWSEKDYNDQNWDEIRVPMDWETEGYNDYNGFAWYRTRVFIQQLPDNQPVYLLLGQIDDCDEVYLNGRLIGSTGKMPPSFSTGYNVERKYIIPKEVVNENSLNTLAIRVYDSYLHGGIRYGRTGIYIDEDYAYMNMVIGGNWKFHLGDNEQWKNEDYNDNLWDKINVPSYWEQEGYDGYDGYAWYRNNFSVPSGLQQSEIFISVGKIDDVDQVYINGKLIGSVYELPKDREYRRKGYEFNARRIYRIPEGILYKNKPNTIAVRVYDQGWGGGIYQGPVGLMDEDNYRRYSNKYYASQSFWDFVIDNFFEE